MKKMGTKRKTHLTSIRQCAGQTVGSGTEEYAGVEIKEVAPSRGWGDPQPQFEKKKKKEWKNQKGEVREKA